MTEVVYDLAVIGGGINGCGIARDAAGRGLSVFLCEQNDLASGTSSASTKLIHGGLRYLEYYEFRLVREALTEREVLLHAAPHIIWPLRFILPHHKGLRPGWLIRLGLFLYDHIGGRKLLPPTSTVNLKTDAAGRVLKENYSRGFEYSDCWVLDSRLVVLNAIDAAERGAKIRTRTPLISATRQADVWKLKLHDKEADKEFEIKARTLVNAAGPWMDALMPKISHTPSPEHIRMVKGSHIIVKKLFDHDRAYIFQNSDNRIIFAIPYEQEFTLIGTTDVDFAGDPAEVCISQEETDYLCSAASEYFVKSIKNENVVSSFSGIRPLFDDGKSEAKAATRDYVLKLDSGDNKAPLLSIYGGKITTYRKLAESVLEKISPFLGSMADCWTKSSVLPGGDFHPETFETELSKLMSHCSILPKDLARRLLRNYGTRAFMMTKGFSQENDLGIHFGHSLYKFEVDYLIKNEWAVTSEDILFRRTKLGLLFNEQESEKLGSYLHDTRVDCSNTSEPDNEK